MSTSFATFQPTFLYELIWDLALAAALVWLGHHRRIRPWGLFALYIAGYSAFRIFEESLRIDSSEHFLGLRLNFYVATVGVIAGLVWFVMLQRRPERAESAVSTRGADGGADGGRRVRRPEPDRGRRRCRGRGRDARRGRRAR